MITITISTYHGLATVEDGVAPTLQRRRGRVAVCFCGWKGVYRFHEEELEMDIEAHRQNEQRQKVKDVLKHLPLVHVEGSFRIRNVVHCAWWF